VIQLSGGKCIRFDLNFFGRSTKACSTFLGGVGVGEVCL
jgi:hypothetical protein